MTTLDENTSDANITMTLGSIVIPDTFTGWQSSALTMQTRLCSWTDDGALNTQVTFSLTVYDKDGVSHHTASRVVTASTTDGAFVEVAINSANMPTLVAGNTFQVRAQARVSTTGRLYPIAHVGTIRVRWT